MQVEITITKQHTYWANVDDNYDFEADPGQTTGYMLEIAGEAEEVDIYIGTIEVRNRDTGADIYSDAD